MKRRRRRRFAAQFTFDQFVEGIVQYAEEQGLTDYSYEEMPLFEFARQRLKDGRGDHDYMQLFRSIPRMALQEVLGEDSFNRNPETVMDDLDSVIAHAAVNEAAKDLM
jgi:hypothetical protein